jgi:hypothetical protein
MPRDLPRCLSLLLAGVAGGLIAGPLTRPLSAAAGPSVSNLAVLLESLKGQPMGLYDGVRFVRIEAGDGTRIIVNIKCEQNLWRVARIEPVTGPADFREEPFQPAEGIGRTAWCTAPVRVME